MLFGTLADHVPQLGYLVPNPEFAHGVIAISISAQRNETLPALVPAAPFVSFCRPLVIECHLNYIFFSVSCNISVVIGDNGNWYTP